MAKRPKDPRGDRGEPFESRREILSGHLVQLEPLALRHVDDLLIAEHDRTIFEFLFDGRIALAYGLRALLHDYIERRTEWPFAIVHRETGLAIGTTRCLNIQSHDLTLEIASWYSSDYYRTRINDEAKRLLLQYVFEIRNFVRVLFNVDVRNEKSIGAMKRIGATPNGTLPKDKILADGSHRTSALFVITNDSWKSSVRPRLETLLKSRTSDDENASIARQIAKLQEFKRKALTQPEVPAPPQELLRIVPDGFFYAGKHHNLKGFPYKILKALLESPDRTVTLDYLSSSVWRVPRTEDTVRSAVCDLRKAIRRALADAKASNSPLDPIQADHLEQGALFWRLILP